VLVSGRVHVHVQTETDVRVKKCESRSVFYVESPGDL
jgi:hypothetical protein